MPAAAGKVDTTFDMRAQTFPPSNRGELAIRLHDRLLTVPEFEGVEAPAIGIEAVDGPPAWRPNRWSVDHHAGVPRPFYDCAAKQVLVATDMGLWRHITKGMAGAPVSIHIVRADEDVALSFALLADPSLVASAAVRRLVELEDALDRSGGTSCGDASDDELGRIAWIFEPYHAWRGAGMVAGAGAALSILNEVRDRVGAFAGGRSRSIELEGAVSVLARSGPVAVVAEHGPYARLGLRRDGIEAFVAILSEGRRRTMTLGLTDVFVPLDLMAVYAELNRLEGRPDGDRWGGGTHVGGSPFAGTQLDADVILAVMARHHRTIGARAAAYTWSPA